MSSCIRMCLESWTENVVLDRILLVILTAWEQQTSIRMALEMKSLSKRMEKTTLVGQRLLEEKVKVCCCWRHQSENVGIGSDLEVCNCFKAIFCITKMLKIVVMFLLLKGTSWTHKLCTCKLNRFVGFWWFFYFFSLKAFVENGKMWFEKGLIFRKTLQPYPHCSPEAPVKGIFMNNLFLLYRLLYYLLQVLSWSEILSDLIF